MRSNRRVLSSVAAFLGLALTCSTGCQTWYGGMTAERIPLFVQEHLEQGRPVEEWIFTRNALPSPESPTSNRDASK